jgi:glycosyltransferase involved in cell wall biosynthesis
MDGVRVFLSDTVRWPSSQRGVARYFRHLVEAATETFGPAAAVCSAHRRDYRPARYVRSFRPGGRPLPRLHDLLASVAARRLGARVFYSPYYGKARTRAAQVFTVFDMIYERMPQYFRREAYRDLEFIAEKRACLERAAALLAISESTAGDLRALYPHLDPARVVVTPLGVEDVFFSAPRSGRPAPERPYLLYVGHRRAYKNFSRLLEAFGRSDLPREVDLRVVSPLPSPFTAEEQAALNRHGLAGRVRLLTAVADEDLRDHYAGARALVYPSESEGFGLPLLEAMAAGTLVATSDLPVMHEVAGPAALYFDPADAESMAEGLRQVVSLPGADRAERLRRGLDRARSFTWERCRRQTMEVFQRLA